MVSIYLLLALVAAIFLAATLVGLLPHRRAKLAALLLDECLARQPVHETEHALLVDVKFTEALRLENIANRYLRKLHAAGLPLPTKAAAKRLVQEALCRSRG